VWYSFIHAWSVLQSGFSLALRANGIEWVDMDPLLERHRGHVAPVLRGECLLCEYY
jgi:hypothetical protein